jgi:hypothetical protein
MEALLKYASTSMTNPGKVAIEVLHQKPDLAARLLTDSAVGPGLWNIFAVTFLHKMPGCIIHVDFGESTIKHFPPDLSSMPLCLFN